MIPFYFFFFNDTATTEIYTLSLHDALPICLAETPRRSSTEAARQCRSRPRHRRRAAGCPRPKPPDESPETQRPGAEDRKSTRLNSSHANISYAVFCLKKKKKTRNTSPTPRL